MRNYKRVAVLVILLLFFLSALDILYQAGYPGIKIKQIESTELHTCFIASTLMGADWKAVYAQCKVSGIDVKDNAGIMASKQVTSGRKGIEWLKYMNTGLKENKALRIYNATKHIDRMLEYLFPVDYKYGYAYNDSWGEPRDFGGDRLHEGTDIICEKGTPIRSVCDGYVEKRGWNTLGGWRVGIRGKDGLYYYYAHLSGFNVMLNQRVRKGDIIGYAGNSGYGQAGQSDKFPPHLHFGIYEENAAVNPYPFLYLWESRYENIAR